MKPIEVVERVLTLDEFLELELKTVGCRTRG